MHKQSLMDIVTDGEELPCSVLIRALEPLSGVETMKKNRNMESLENLTNGPGKLCKALQIDHSLDGLNICSLESEVYVLDTQISDEINESIRIGITTNKEPLLRYYVANNKFVSR
jgi:DNA-3-methyladenine glycosylase